MKVVATPDRSPFAKSAAIAPRSRPPAPPTEEVDTVDALGEHIAELAAHLGAATYRLLVLLREFDERRGWAPGFRSCAHWLHWRTGIDLGAAREKVRTARALVELPAIAAAMSRGELSYSKVRALTRAATPANEEGLLELARVCSTAQLETLVRRWRSVLADQFDPLDPSVLADPGDADPGSPRLRKSLPRESLSRSRHARRNLSWHWDDDGMLVLRARLDPEAGAVLVRALEAAEDRLYSEAPRSSRDEVVGHDPATDSTPVEQRRADALSLLADAALDADLAGRSGGERFQVVVHVDAETLQSRRPVARGSASPVGVDAPDPLLDATPPDPLVALDPLAAHDPLAALEPPAPLDPLALLRRRGELEDGVDVSAEACRRLGCDSSRVVMTHAADGSPLDVGRKTRTIPSAIRRALEHRDRGCRFPGCSLHRRPRLCDAHHVRHWADGGETRLDNLLLLCRRHHRAIHEQGFTLELDSSGAATFRRPGGRPLPPVPPPPLLPPDPLAELVADHRQLGLEIDALTLEAAAGPGPFDLRVAVDWLVAIEEEERGLTLHGGSPPSTGDVSAETQDLGTLSRGSQDAGRRFRRPVARAERVSLGRNHGAEGDI